MLTSYRKKRKIENVAGWSIERAFANVLTLSLRLESIDGRRYVARTQSLVETGSSSRQGPITVRVG